MPRRNHPRHAPRRPREEPPTYSRFSPELWCERCTKFAGRTEEEAWTVAMAIYESRPGGTRPTRVYSCAGDGNPPWHWTSKP